MSQAGILSENTAIGADIKTLTGDAGGAVGADLALNVDIIGTAAQGLSFLGTPASNQIQGTIEDATSAQKGVASFDAYDFVVTAGNVVLRPSDSVLFVGKWGDDAADGLTFESAKLTIQSAVTAANAGDTILVHPGTYTETVTHAANNVTLIAQGKPNSVIITQADANVVNFSTYTGIQYKFFGINCTAATTAINTVQGTTGSCTFKECQLGMTSAAAIVAASQPAVGAITGAGRLVLRIGQVTYAHTGACGGTAQKGAFKVGDGGVVEIGLIKNLDITNSGTALVSSVGVDTSSTGYFDMYENVISITDPNATIVAGLGYIGGTGTDHEYRRNTIHVTATANTGYGIYAADTASTTRSFYNHIHVVDTGGSSYSFFIGASATLTSQFDDIIADDGETGTGTLVMVSSEADGDLKATGDIMASSITLDGISGSYADSEEVALQAGVQTANAVATQIAAITLPTNTMCVVEARFGGFKSDYSEACGGYLNYTARRAGAGAVEVATPNVVVDEDSAGAPTVDADVSGNDIRLLVVGVAASTFNWVVSYRYHFVKTNA